LAEHPGDLVVAPDDLLEGEPLPLPDEHLTEPLVVADVHPGGGRVRLDRLHAPTERRAPDRLERRRRLESRGEETRLLPSFIPERRDPLADARAVPERVPGVEDEVRVMGQRAGAPRDVFGLGFPTGNASASSARRLAPRAA